MADTTSENGDSPRPAEGLPRLAFAYHPHSFPTMSIAEAAEGVCRLIWIVDTSDPDVSSMSRLLRRLGEVVDVAGLSLEQAATAVASARPDGILALADELLVHTARLAELLELPFLRPEVAEVLTDKYRQRAALKRSGLPVPGFWRIPGDGDADAWSELERDAGFPAVLKPRRGEGSRNTVRVNSLAELRAAIAETPSEPGSCPPELVLEEYLADRPGAEDRHFADYVSVESVVSDSRISHLAITGRFPPAHPFRETGFFIPCAYGEDDRDTIAEVAAAAVRAVGVEIGLLHTEIKMTPQGPRVIELNGRIGGGVPEMLADATGVQMLPMAMRVALGEPVVFDSMPECTSVGYLLYVQAPAQMTRITAVEGLEALRLKTGVEEVTLNRGPGRAVDWRAGNHGHVFSVRGSVADHETLSSIERYANGEVLIDGD